MIGDLQTQIGGILYGKIPKDLPHVREIHCIVLPPQQGSVVSVQFPDNFPSHPLLEDLQALGWIHSEPHETSSISTTEIATHLNLLESIKSMDPETSIIIRMSFTPGIYCLPFQFRFLIVKYKKKNGTYI